MVWNGDPLRADSRGAFPTMTLDSSSTQSEVLMRVEHVTKSYGRIRALSDVSFSVRRGEILGLIGPNGAGKTTLFECLAGVLPADGGVIYQRRSSTVSSERKSSTVSSEGQRSIGPTERSSLLFYMPDGIAPWPSQSVEWALDFTLGFFGGPARMREDIVRRFDLEPLLKTAIGTLSKGQRKRVLVAIGLLTPQPVLLADEPFDGLDLRQTRDLSAALRDYAAAGRTLFLSIHQISDAARVCDRFVLLSGGRVRGEGTLEELSVAASLASTRSASMPADLEEVFLALT